MSCSYRMERSVIVHVYGKGERRGRRERHYYTLTPPICTAKLHCTGMQVQACLHGKTTSNKLSNEHRETLDLSRKNTHAADDTTRPAVMLTPKILSISKSSAEKLIFRTRVVVLVTKESLVS